MGKRSLTSGEPLKSAFLVKRKGATHEHLPHPLVTISLKHKTVLHTPAPKKEVLININQFNQSSSATCEEN
jgi:hypothetical protein